MDNVFDVKRRAESGERRRRDLITHAGDAEAQPVELVVAGGDDGKFQAGNAGIFRQN